MNELSLKMKLAVGFGTLLLILTVMGIIGYESAVTTTNLSGEVDRQVHKKDMAVATDVSVEKQVSALRAFLLTGNEERLKSGEEARRTLPASMDILEKCSRQGRERKLLL